MARDEKTIDAFRQVLQEELRSPVYLTQDEVEGGWSDLFPVLATSLPAPFPIFGRDEERVVTWGYQLLLSDGVLKLRRDLETLVEEVGQEPDRVISVVEQMLENGVLVRGKDLRISMK